MLWFGDGNLFSWNTNRLKFKGEFMQLFFLLQVHLHDALKENIFISKNISEFLRNKYVLFKSNTKGLIKYIVGRVNILLADPRAVKD